jgi:Zn-finger nucleic acid-binding protein
MNCPSCGAPMHPEGSSLKCDYCHSVVVPDHDTSGVRVLAEVVNGDACPVCSVPLMQATLGVSPLLYCTKCHGMLVAMMEFESLVDAARTASAPIAALPANVHDLDRKINCPHCHRPMEAHFYINGSNVVMDTCEHCCLHWLDHDELARIAQAAPNQPNPIDTDGATFYDPAPDSETFQVPGREADPVSEAVDVLLRMLKPRN